MEAVKERLEEATNLLQGASNDRDFDQFIKGLIRAFKEVLAAEPAITVEDIENEVQA